jgi:ribosomal-protein-alanine acetyltransferase
MIEEITNSSFLSPILSTEYVDNELNNNPFAHFVVYKNNGVILGYLYYSLIYDRIEINQFEVLEEYRNKKIGSSLLDYLVNLGNYDITLEVRIDNFSAIHLYQKFGFKSVSIRKNYYNGIDGILMERKFEGD